MSKHEPLLIAGDGLEDLSKVFGWSFSKNELAEGYLRRTIESWIDGYRRDGLPGLEVTFSETTPFFGWYSDHIGECIDWGWFEDNYAKKMDKVKELDFRALAKFVPTYHCPAWPRPRFWSQHWTDVIWHTLRNPVLQRRFRRVAQRGTRTETIDHFRGLGDNGATASLGHGAGPVQPRPASHGLAETGLSLP
jgi:hypothetical protein